MRIHINFNLKNQIYFFSLVRRLYWSDVCTGPTFVLVQGLYQSYVCTSLTFVLVRRLYCPTFVSLRFVPSDVCGSDVCTSTSNTNFVYKLQIKDNLIKTAYSLKIVNLYEKVPPKKMLQFFSSCTLEFMQKKREF